MTTTTLAGAPDLAAAASAFAGFCTTIAQLRDPHHGCPWDLQQDHASLRRYMLEEAYEAAAVMVDAPDSELCEELGDVLLQVVLNAQVALDRRGFSIVDVIQAIDQKMRRRHPQVFAPAGSAATVASVQANWQEIKAQEKLRRVRHRNPLLAFLQLLLTSILPAHRPTRSAASPPRSASTGRRRLRFWRRCAPSCTSLKRNSPRGTSRTPPRS